MIFHTFAEQKSISNSSKKISLCLFSLFSILCDDIPFDGEREQINFLSFQDITKFFSFLLFPICLHITTKHKCAERWRKDRFESQSPPRDSEKSIRCDGVRDRAMAITRIHRGSLMSVCQAVAWLAYVFLRKPKPGLSGSSARTIATPRRPNKRTACFLRTNLDIKPFSIERPLGIVMVV